MTTDNDFDATLAAAREEVELSRQAGLVEDADDLEAAIERTVAASERERFDRSVQATRETSARLRAEGMIEDADELDAEIEKSVAACRD